MMPSKKYFLLSLRGQLITITLIIITFLIFLIGILQYALMKDFLYGNRAESIHTQMMSWPPNPYFLKQNTNITDIPPILRNENDHTPTRPIMFQPGMEVSYIDKSGNIEIISDDKDELPPIISQEQYAELIQLGLKQSLERYYIYSDAEGNNKMVIFRDKIDNRGTVGLLQVSVELHSLQKQLYTQLGIYIAVSLIALIAALLLLLPSLRKALSPLSNVIRVVERTNAENLSDKLPVTRKQYEIDRLSHAYNNMLDRIDRSFELERQTNERMRQFIADASHELRTPITSISGFIEVLQRGALNNKEHLVTSLKTMAQESKRMTMLVESLLQLAKLDITNEQKTLEVESLDLSHLLKGMKLQLDLMADERTLIIEMEHAPFSSIEGNKHQVKQVILNLVQNAIQHTDKYAGKITITLTELPYNIQMCIADNGIGIAKEHLPQLFQRFFRVDKARTRASGGAGLGLSISRAIIDAHQGIIQVDSEIGKGTCFTIQFPKLAGHLSINSHQQK